MVKMLIKNQCLHQEYDCSFIPFPEGDSPNHVTLHFDTASEKSKMATLMRRDQALFNPTMNSWRKSKDLSLCDSLSASEGRITLKKLVSPDVNMYLAMSAILGIQNEAKSIESSEPAPEDAEEKYH